MSHVADLAVALAYFHPEEGPLFVECIPRLELKDEDEFHIANSALVHEGFSTFDYKDFLVMSHAFTVRTRDRGPESKLAVLVISRGEAKQRMLKAFERVRDLLTQVAREMRSPESLTRGEYTRILHELKRKLELMIFERTMASEPWLLAIYDGAVKVLYMREGVSLSLLLDLLRRGELGFIVIPDNALVLLVVCKRVRGSELLSSIAAIVELRRQGFTGGGILRELSRRLHDLARR